MVRPTIQMPEKGLPHEKILEEMDSIASEDVKWEEGKLWSLVYHATEEHATFLKKAHDKFFSKNALSPLAFPSLRKFETEVVSMVADLLNGDKKCCGSMTSGGTESIMTAVLTYREWAEKKFPHIKNPEMVMPSSAHPAFEKSAEYFKVKSIRVPVDEKTHRADVKAMKKAISENTILLIASACDYPRGVVDPISEIAALAQERGIGMHVDACLGGFILPFVKELGYPVPEFDFSVPGVTSISADIHKYGYGPKGTSTIIYRTEKIWKHQLYVYADWSGGVYIAPTMRGTRAGGPIAAAWAGIKALGKEKYLKLAEEVMNTSKKIINEINAMDSLYILGEPVMSVFSFTSDEFNIFQLGDFLDSKGWHLDRLQYPPALHMIVNPHHSKIADKFLKDLKDAVREVKENPEKVDKGEAAMYGMIASLPNRQKVKKYILNFLKDQYKI
ncbi:MAG: pyridoxal phosphate-dependent decarboxylase family protein [Promethearchaeota archaeon]